MPTIKEQIDICLVLTEKARNAFNLKMQNYAQDADCGKICPGVNKLISSLRALKDLLKDKDKTFCEQIDNLLSIIKRKESGHDCFDIYIICRIDSLLNYLKAKNDYGKDRKIFISHSSVDESIIKLFVKMLQNLGLTKIHMFCSSVQGYGIPLGSGNIYNYLKNQFTDNNLLVLMMLSDNFYASPACLNEMGAAWIQQANYQSILLPGYNYRHIKGTISPNDISFKLDDKLNRKSRLDELRDLLFDFLNMPFPDNSLWQKERDKFVSGIDRLQKKVS